MQGSDKHGAKAPAPGKGRDPDVIIKKGIGLDKHGALLL